MVSALACGVMIIACDGQIMFEEAEKSLERENSDLIRKFCGSATLVQVT
jgi:hypothetical protein